MPQMTGVAKARAEQLAAKVTDDARWDLNDELLCQVFGFTLYGYVFGVGRFICFLDVGDINQIVESQLTRLGHSHFGSEDLSELVDAIFANTQKLRAAQS